jgi:CheY-like chemotaxis protein
MNPPGLKDDLPLQPLVAGFMREERDRDDSPRGHQARDLTAAGAFAYHPLRRQRERRGHRILLVEDNRDSIAALELFLHAHGFEVAVALDGQQALDVLRAGFRPSVILLDVMMPGKNAHGFRAEQKADPALAAIPVIVFSGAYDVGAIAERLGVRDYLTKPFDIQRLLDGIRRHCEPRIER